MTEDNTPNEEREVPFSKTYSSHPPKLPKPHLVNGIPVSYIPGEQDQEEESDAADPIDSIIEESVSAPPPPPPAPKPVSRKAPSKRQSTAPVKRQPDPLPVREEVPPPPPAEPEQPVVSAPKQVKHLSGNNAIAMFKQAVGAGYIPIQLYSSGEEVMMRELTVTDQKTLSKTALINSNRRDIMYNAQNSLINSCIKTDGFDIRNFTEFDRIVLLLHLYEQNYFTNDIHYTCPKCGKENVYKMDFSKVLARVKDSWRPDKSYVMNHGGKEFHFTLGWPRVDIISNFYSSYYKQYQKANEKTQTTIDQLSNVEYLVMFIREIELFLAGQNEGVSLNLDDYTYDERTDLIDSLPQNLVFDDKMGVVSKVISDFTDPLNKAFRYENCAFCGAETEEGIGSIADFT